MGIPKKATEIWLAALGNGNVSGGGPYDSDGNRRPGAVEHWLYPAGGDFGFDPAPPPPVDEMHNGGFTGRSSRGDDAAKSANASLTLRDMKIRNFVLGRESGTVSTQSDSETTNSPSDVPFHFWIKRVTQLQDGTQEIAIIGHCYATPSQKQGEQEAVTLAVQVKPVEFETTHRDGFVYLI